MPAFILPTAGSFIIANNGANFSSAPTQLAGTLVLGGSNVNATAVAVMTGPLTLSDLTGTNPDRTIALANFSGSGQGTVNQGGIVSLAGIALNANLTIAGGSNFDVLGGFPAFATTPDTLGNITTSDGGKHSVTVAMAPSGVVRINPTATGWTGGTTLVGGTLDVVAPTVTAGPILGTGGITFAGGILRIENSSSNLSVTDPITVGPSGGTILSNGGGGTATTIAGQIKESSSGAGPLTLGWVGSSGRLILAADDSGFDAGFNLTAGSNDNYVDFNGSYSTGSSGGVAGADGVLIAGPNDTTNKNIITVPAGVAIGFLAAPAGTTGPAAGETAYQTLVATAPRIVVDSSGNSELDLTNIPGSQNLNLSGTASSVPSTSPLNLNVFLTSSQNLTYTGTIVPALNSLNTYKFTTANTGASLTFNLLNQMTGANNLLISAPIEPTTSATNVGGLIIIAQAQNFTGTTTFTGTSYNAINLASSASAGQNPAIGSVTLTAPLTGTSTILVDNRMSATLAAGSAGTGNTTSGATVTIKGLSTLTDNTANGLTTLDNLILGGADTGGGTLAGSGSQVLAGLTVAPGSSSITDTGIVTLAAYTRSAGGTVNFAANTTKFSAIPTGTGVSGGILIGATLAGNDFVAVPIVGAPRLPRRRPTTRGRRSRLGPPAPQATSATWARPGSAESIPVPKKSTRSITQRVPRPAPSPSPPRSRSTAA